MAVRMGITVYETNQREFDPHTSEQFCQKLSSPKFADNIITDGATDDCEIEEITSNCNDISMTAQAEKILGKMKGDAV